MSTILKALQRLEGEKGGAGEAGGLGEGLVRQGEPMVRESAGTRWRLGINACLVALLLGFFLWWMIPADRVTQPSAPQPSPAVTAPPERSPASSPPRRVAAPPPRHLSEAPASRERAAEAPPPPPVEPPAARERVVEAPPPPAIEKPVPRERVAEAPLPPASHSPPAPEPAVQPSPGIEKAPAPKVSPPAPVATLRPPKVTVKRTIWHPTPERRVAEIEAEGRKGVLELHEGDAVGTLVVAEIQPSGVVFLHGGEKFLRKVGSGR